MNERLVTARELSEYLSVNVSWVWLQAREGKIPCIRVGRYMRFSLTAVMEALSVEKGGEPHGR